ncbi:MAG: hypothetical protein LBU89_14100, partial [Fibromonadaceae bacterium]|nr:hypothetical protein [Fibromonadaceae bacterium]
MRKFCLFVLFLFFSFSFGQVTVTRSFSGSLVRDVETRCTNTDGCWLSTSAGVQCGFFPQNTAMCPLGTQFFGIANYGGRSGVCVSLAHGCTILSSSCFVDNGTGGSCTTVHGGCDTNKGMSLVGFGNWIQCVESGQCGHTVPVTISASGTITLSCPDDICERVPDLCPSSSSASESSSSSEFDSSS